MRLRFGFVVQGSDFFWVQGFGCRVEIVGLRVSSGVRSRTSGFRYRLGVGSQIYGWTGVEDWVEGGLGFRGDVTESVCMGF